EKKEQKPYLQGWAVVENTTDEDWNGIRMALISGRPISFQMNLYDSLFLKRPVVEPELFASLRPPTYSGTMDGEVELMRARRSPAKPRAQEQARKHLAEAAKEPEQLLRQLREEESDRVLIALRGRCEEMLRLQLQV